MKRRIYFSNDMDDKEIGGETGTVTGLAHSEFIRDEMPTRFASRVKTPERSQRGKHECEDD